MIAHKPKDKRPRKRRPNNAFTRWLEYRARIAKGKESNNLQLQSNALR